MNYTVNSGVLLTGASDTLLAFRDGSLNAQANYLKGHVDTVRGSYKAWNADVQFRVRPNFTLGAGYSATRFFLESTDPTDSGLFRFDYKGPQAFIRVSL